MTLSGIRARGRSPIPLRRVAAATLSALLLVAPGAARADRLVLESRSLAAPESYVETQSLAPLVNSGVMPATAERLPDVPLVPDIEGAGRTLGAHGGVWRMLINKAKRVNYGVVYGYARLVGYGRDFTLEPDILESVEVSGDRLFILRLRPGHRWSDGHPFTSEDFRYYWEEIANNAELSPNGPPETLRANDEPPVMAFPDAHTVIIAWKHPNPTFLKSLAAARPPFIYRPAHYLRQFHADHAEPEWLEEQAAAANARNWAALHNRKDNMYRTDNPELPTLQPWQMVHEINGRRFLWKRNPYFHRVDAAGRQLPYIDVLEMEVASGGLIPAKTNAGEAELQSHGLSFSNTAILKQGEEVGGYRTLLWSNGAASQIALYPNLNYNDPEWRDLMRQRSFRQALSLGVNRRLINRSLYFGLGVETGNGLLPESPLFNAEFRDRYAVHDLERANAMLDALGLDARAADGTRLLPSGRPMEMVVESAGERPEVSDALELITESWRRIGVKLLVRPLDRDILRNRVFSGVTMMSVWYGWDNGVASAADAPAALAPMMQDSLQWPKWGQHYQTHGGAGEPADMAEPVRLLELARAWRSAPTLEARAEIWREMLAIHAEEVFVIGLVSETPQPIAASSRLRNIPERGVWSWDPGSHFGVYRSDEFFFSDMLDDETAAAEEAAGAVTAAAGGD